MNKTLAYRDCLVYCAQAAYVNGGFVIEHLDVTRGIAYELFYTTGQKWYSSSQKNRL